MDSVPREQINTMDSCGQDSFLRRHLGGTPYTFPCTIAYNGSSLSTHALVDTGASGDLFVSVTFAKKLIRYLDTPQLRGFTPQPVAGFDG